MAQCRSNSKVKDSLRVRGSASGGKDDSGCDTSPEEPLGDSLLPDTDGEDTSPNRARSTSTINLRSKSRADSQSLPDVGSTGSSPTTHSIMKTKQSKDELEKSNYDEATIEPKTRQARKKFSGVTDEDKKVVLQYDPKTSKEPKKILKPKAVVKKRPLGVRKTLSGKKLVGTVKGTLKNVIKQTRGRKPAVRSEPDNSQDKETFPLIPASEIKKEPIDDTTPNSRSSSPKTGGKRQRLTSDKIMMKSVLGDSPSSLVLGPRTSPYSMRSERSNSPSFVETKNLRSGKPRKVKSNLLNEVVMKEQKKRRRLLSDSKTSDSADTNEEAKKLKRGRSCSREGSEISKCSDITESDVSLSETLMDTDSRELNKKLEKPKTDLDLDFENNVQISITEKVPSHDPKLTEKLDTETRCNINEKSKRNMSLKRSTSLDSDNNNSNRLKLDNLNSSDVEDKNLDNWKTEQDTLIEACSILTSMSKTFNSKEVSKNIRKARRGRKVAAKARLSMSRAPPVPVAAERVQPAGPAEPAPRPEPAGPAEPARRASATVTAEPAEEKQETLETLSKEIDDLINNLDQNIDRDHEMANESIVEHNDQSQTKSVAKFYGLSKPLGDNNSIVTPETPVKDKDASATSENTPSKNDDSENIRLHYEEDSLERATDNIKPEISYKVSTVASIDKLMDRLKVFEEFDKKRQRQESESKSTDSKTVMVTNDVVLIPKSGAHIKQLTDVQSVRSPERPIEKENVLSCFENNSAISIVKRDYQARRSIDIDLPNSVTLIKRNSFSSRKESTSSNHSRDTDAISIFEKSLGKDVTLTEIRKSVDKAGPAPQLDLQHFANLHQNNPTTTLKGVVLDTSQISITPRVFTDSKDIRKSRDSKSRKSSETGIETEEKNPVIEKIKSPPHQVMSPPPLQVKSPLPVQVKSPPPLQVKSPPPLQVKSLSPLQVKSPPPLKVKSPPPLQVKSPPPLQVNSPPHQAPTLPPQVTSTPAQVMSMPQGTSTPQVTSTPKVTSNPQITSTPKVTSTPQVTSPPKVTSTPQGTSTAKVTSTPQGMSTAKVASTPQGTSTAKVKSPPPKVTSPPVPMPAPVAIKSPEAQPMETEALAPPLENIKPVPADICLATELPKVDSVKQPEAKLEETVVPTEKAKIVQPEAMEVEPVEKVEEKVVEKPVELKEVKEPESKTETPAKSKLSETAELAKPGKSPGKRSKSARNSTENQPGPSNMLNETPESQRRKENVLRTLGLLTHKAAKEAKIQKLKEKQRIYGAGMSGVMSKKSSKGSGDYTGTLKTVIKLNRGAGERDKKKYRSSLKMTFQKSKHRSGKPTPEPGVTPGEDDAYYTIERPAGFAGAGSEGGHRKTYSNRLNNHAETEAAPEPSEPKETLNLVIPEKASSFSIHPGRLCQDQCFYCGGKFGLFDTPCHIAQMKSHERQKKVLDNEERLTIDSCLCDACYRHVDRRANCPSYRKRARPPAQPSKPASPVAEPEGEEAGSSGEAPAAARCHARACAAPAARTIRRKWLIKMRPAVNRVLKLESDYPGLHTLGLCGAHYAALAPLQACALCRRRLTRHHNVHLLHQGHEELNPLLAAAGIPVTLGDKPVLCKMCRYYTSLLQRPGHNDKHAGSYRRRLLQVYNIEVPAESEPEGEEPAADEAARRKKPRNKHRRKPSDPDTTGDSASPERAEPEPGKEPDAQKPPQPLEEDIESLISSNKILVPGAKPADPSLHSDGSDPDQYDTDNTVIDKQTELQLLLQKQNNPSQFLHNQANLTQKNRNMLKVQNLGIQKPGLQHRINDKNAKRLHKLGQIIVQKDKMTKQDESEAIEQDVSPDATMKNISLNEECTIESIPNKKPADINTLKNKWQQSESFTQVKKNLSELSKKLTVEKEPKKTSDTKYSNPVRRLETNPSISVRELFPGEEEMNLQCNIEFGNVKGVTPEGWEKCNTTVQYDVETKKLWTELQRPYGNQSSFLRHLILLEKYFRSGDLVLSHNATPNAANYSDSVQSRLRAYDNVVNDTPRRAEPAISLIEFRKKPALNGKSLLKSSHSDDKDLKKTMPPPPVFQKPKPKDKKNKPLPPELIAINTPNAQGRKAIQNVLHNIQQLVKGVSASDPTEVAASPLPPGTPRLEGTLQGPRVEGNRLEGSRLEVTRLEAPREKKEHKPDTPKKQKTTSKPWRPTLMPITPENLARVAREPIQTAVDGRRLPSLVKVMSAGQQFHITLHDYNKMCVMRRDKLQQLGQDKPKPDPETVVTEVQTSAMLGNGGTVVQNIPDKESDLSDLAQIGSNAATILKNVGLKNITIAPITPKTATVTSHTLPSPVVSAPASLMTTPLKLQLGPAVSISEAPNLPLISSPMIMPKIPKSLTVIPQSVTPQGAVASPQIFTKTDSSRP